MTAPNVSVMRSVFGSPLLKRFIACIAGSLVLALMWGPQEGTTDDYGLAFHQAVMAKRVFWFLAIGVVAFLLITYWPKVRPAITRPGAPSFGAGVVTVIAAYTLMHWFDPLDGAKFGAVRDAVKGTGSISFVAKWYFGWLAWVGLLVLLIVGGAAIALRHRILAWVAAALSVVMAVLSVVAKEIVAHKGASLGPDHSLGSYVAAFGFVVMAVALGAAAVTNAQVAATRAAIEKVVSFRTGLPVVVLGAVVGLCAMTFAAWYAPHHYNSGISKTGSLFKGTGLAPLAAAYLGWLGWVLFVVTAVAAAAATWLRNRLLGWTAAALGVVSVILTLVTIYQFSKKGAALGVDAATGPWQNLGPGGWIQCIALTLLGAGGLLVATDRLRTRSELRTSDIDASAPSTTRNLAMLGVALALFFPPTMTDFWQKVLVSEIGVYVLLAVGLNVVVGWAGLLDLGFIAFYAIGSYTTAYLTGSLPHRPPSWLHMSPLWAIPFAIVICLIAGLLLGAPTLRLRGDYLAIVTLGFGEIIRITAINNPGNITNSTRGPSPAVPHPVIRIGPIHWTWGLNNLQYWYLLLAIIVIVVLLFHRLEGSRLGRAWAAVREDEVAAQATGINTTKVKLLAFAIGASTSGVAGVFFASQVGFFTPDNFLLNNSILVVAYVVFGGMGSLPGAMAGAAVLTWLPEFLKDQVPANDRQMWIGVVVLAMMIFRPAGLIPARRRKAELHGLDEVQSSEVRAVPAGEGL